MIKKVHRYTLLLMASLLTTAYKGAAQELPFKKGTDTVAIMNIMRNARKTIDADSAVRLYRLAAEKSIDANFYYGASTALICIASTYCEKSNYQEAKNYITQAIPYADKLSDRSRIAYCHNTLGAISLRLGNYVTASENFFAGLSKLKTIDSSNCEAAIYIYTNLANISEELHQQEKKIFYLNEAERLARTVKMNPESRYVALAGVLINEGNCYSSFPDTAIRYYMEALDLVKKMDAARKEVHVRFQSMADVNLGSAYEKKGDYEKAIRYYQESIRLAKNNYKYVALGAAFDLADVLRHLKKYREAETVLLQALNESKNLQDRKQITSCYAGLAEVYKDSKQFEKAVSCMDSEIAINDSLMVSEKDKAISQVEARYNSAEKDRQIARSELLIAQQKTKITQKNIWIGSITSAVLMLALLSFGFYRNRSLRQDSLIKSLKQQNTISVLKGVVQGEEKERMRLARDLHDGIGGMLSATKMRFMALRHDHADLIGSTRYLEAMGLLDIMGDEIRKTSHNLMPEALLKQNLADALQTYCNSMQSGTDTHIEFQSYGPLDGLANDFKLNVYRIVQELLKNTLQHAHATYVSVQLMMLEKYLTISVEDNGAGFNPSEVKDGIGLSNLKTRVLSHEGHYTVKSEPGKGTTVFIEFEMPQKNNNDEN